MLKITSKIITLELKNRYVKNAKISEAKFRQLLRYFALGLDAGQIAELSNLFPIKFMVAPLSASTLLLVMLIIGAACSF